MKKIYFASFLIMLLFIQCKDDDIIEDPNNDNVQEIETIDVTIVFPESTDIDFNDLTLVTSLNEVPINNDGTASIPFVTGERVLAVVLGVDNEPMLTGYIREGKTEISAESTLETSFYLGYGTHYLQEVVREEFLFQSSSIPNFNETTNQLATHIQVDPYYLASDEYVSWFEEQLLATKDGEIFTSLRSVDVDANDRRSGLQVSEANGLSMQIRNIYRRRAHAFLYKTAIKPNDSPKQILINNIASENASSTFDTQIEPTKAKREFLGVIGDWASGTGINFFATDTDPINLEIGDNDEYVDYKVRVVGPSISATNQDLFTDQEYAKYEELFYETLVMDLVLPVFLDVVGESKALGDLDASTFQNFTNVFIAAANSVPSIAEPIEQGNMKLAAEEFFFSFYNNSMGEFRDDLLEAFRDGILNYLQAKNKSPKFDISAGVMGTVDLFEKATKYLQWTDRILKLADYAAIYSSLELSEQLEEWDVKAKKDPVSITPPNDIAFPFIKKYFQAIAKNTTLGDGDSWVYEWEVSGNYGELRSDLGQSGLSFETSAEEVYYMSEMNDNDIPEDAEETVIANVYIRKGIEKDFVGTDTTKLYVKAFRYEIKPDGATIMGGDGINLNIVRPDLTDEITNNGVKDFKIVWSTSGTYGTFAGGENVVTRYNDNDLNYKALDKDVEHGIETINARIYGKLKSEPDSEYRLNADISAEVNIKNEENKIYKVLTHTVENFGPTNDETYSYCSTFAYYPVTVEEDAVHYSITITELYPFWLNIGSTDSWTPDEREATNGEYKGLYGFLYQSTSTPTWLFEGCGDNHSAFNGVVSSAQLEITLE